MAAFDLSRRSAQAELMDSDETDFETFRACLVDLAKVNVLTLAYRPTLHFFEGLAKSGRLSQNRAFTVVDVGSGYGDMLRQVDRWAQRRGFNMNFVGVDLNPWSARAGREATAAGRPIRFVTENILEHQAPDQIDVVISSLLAHHLDNASLVRFVAWMEANAAIGWFVNDLHRHPIPLHVFRQVSRALRFHHFVQHDGVISIARAFTAQDWRDILASAGVPDGAARIDWRFPFRFCVSRVRA
jgi:SAM-dependent methyltransferase